MVTTAPHTDRIGIAFDTRDSNTVLAHEWRNALAPLRAAAQCLREAGNSPDEIRTLVSIITDEVDRLDALVDSLLGCAQIKPALGPVSLNAVVSGVVASYSLPSAKPSVRLELDLDPSLPVVWADERLVCQVIHNLLRNAAESALGPNGVVRVSTRVSDDHKAVAISVCDNGPGIPSEALVHIFEPGYTTKPHGCGIGLAVCREIVHAHGGEMFVHSQPGTATVFTVSLPLDGPRAQMEVAGDE